MKPYTPYVKSSNNKAKPQSPPRSPNTTSSYGSSSAYAPAPAAGGGYSVPATTSGYAPAPAASGYSNSGGYAPSTGGYSSSGGYTPSTGYSSSSAYAPAPANNTYSTTSTTTAARVGGGYSTSPMPPPKPQAPSIPVSAQGDLYGSGGGSSYGTSKRNDGGKPYEGSSPGFAVATPVVGGGFDAAPHGSVYHGGPTGGLVSEGNPTQCHKVDYEIKGHEMQLVEIELDPEETIVAEAGAMMFIDEGIDFEAKFGDGSEPKQGFWSKLMSAGGRLLTGESLFMTHFTNKLPSAKARVAFAAPFPGNIIPVNMTNFGNKIICQKDAFLCAAKGTKLSIYFHKRLGSGLFGGEGFILQKLEGDGMAFIHAGGTIIKRELRGEKLRLDTGCLVGFTDGISYDVQFVKGLKSMFFGGEGLFLATLEGHGTVWLQSLPFSRMADRIIQNAPSAGGRRQGEGSALTGGFGDLVNGDGFGFNL